MLTVSRKIKLTIIAEYFPVEVDGSVILMPSSVRIPPYNRVVIQRLLITKLSSILSFPPLSHMKDQCHVFTTKVSVIFLYMRDMF